MILQLLWSIWVGWLIPYPLASPRYSPFFKWSPISAVNLRNLNFGFRTDKSEKNLIFHNFMWNYLKNMAFDHKTNFEILSPKPAEAIFQDFRGTQSRGVAMRIWLFWDCHSNDHQKWGKWCDFGDVLLSIFFRREAIFSFY